MTCQSARSFPDDPVNDQQRQLGQPRTYLDRTTSTMDDIARLAPSSQEGLTVVAREQTQGRGRADRKWQDAPGSSLLFSTLLLPGCSHSLFQPFPVLAGVAVAEAIQHYAGVVTQVKWPNDVLIDGRKVAGILVTTRVTGELVESAVIGIGINLSGVPDDLESTAISLAEAAHVPVVTAHLLDELLARLSRLYNRVLKGDLDELVRRWHEMAAYVGDQVCVLVGSDRHCGTLKGIDRTGALQLVDETGSLTSVHVGDVVRGPFPAGP